MKTYFKWGLVIILLIVGLGFVFNRQIENQLVIGYHSQITRQQVKQNAGRKANYNFQQVKSVTAGRALQARLNFKNVKVVGELAVPELKMRLPIGLGVDNNTLLLGAGTMIPNQQMGHGNYALAGHHMLNPRALFTPLYQHAKVGTEVDLTDLKSIYQYRITMRQIIAPTAVQVLNPTKKTTLTLITCNDSGSKRLYLKGRLVRKISMHQANSQLLKAFQIKTNNHNVLAGY